MSFLMLGAVLLLALLPQSASAVESCSTARRDQPLADSGDESGIGGTGIQDARPDRAIAPGDDSDSGIGGTGILGTVTIVDPLCVNGLLIEVPDEVKAQNAANGTSDGQLALGMVVWIRATGSEGSLVANQIRIVPGIQGQIESVSNRGHQTVIAGQTIVLPDDVRRGPGVANQAPVRGQWRTVYGLRNDANHLVASRIEVDREWKTSERPIRFAEWLAEGDPVDSISIEGYVAGSAARPRLAGLELDLPDSMSATQRDAFRPGHRMTAVGRISKQGAFRVERSTILGRPERENSIDRAPGVPPQNDATSPRSDGSSSPAPKSDSPSATNSERPQRKEIKRPPRRPPTAPPRIDRPRHHRPVDRPRRVQIDQRS